MDWGFTSFLALKEIANLQKGFLVDDTLEVRGRQTACMQPIPTATSASECYRWSHTKQNSMYSTALNHPWSSFRKAALPARYPAHDPVSRLWGNSLELGQIGKAGAEK